MLLNFSLENYKMYVEHGTLSMEAASKQKDLEYSLLREKVAGKERKGICSAVIYGPNAAGKSSLIQALHDFQEIVMRGSISAEGKGALLSLVPPSSQSEPAPTSFEVLFTRLGHLYEYSVVASLGRFGKPDDPRNVLEESLKVDGHTVFRRENQHLTISIPRRLKNYYSETYIANREAADKLVAGVDPCDLFLDNGFRTMVSPRIATEVTSWFANDLLIVTKANEATVTPYADDTTDSLGKHFTEAARVIGALKRRLSFKQIDNSSAPLALFSEIETPSGTVAVPSDIYESLGTMRFLNTLPFIVHALQGGKVLVMDELDASLHPMVVMSLVNAFHDDKTNTRKAQLVFTTHNSTLLDGSLLRRDEIKIVEPNDDGDRCITYALSDFGTSGHARVKKEDDYQRNYFKGRYGGIRDTDIVPFLRQSVNRWGVSELTQNKPDSQIDDMQAPTEARQ